MKFRIPATHALLAAGLLAAGPAPASADWLVTRQGDRVETRGPWKEKGKLLVFTTVNGRLSSLRLSEVDLEASRRATAEAERARVEAEEARRRPAEPAAPKREVRAITDKDVAHVDPIEPVEPAAPTATGPAGDESKDKAPAPKKRDLEVVSWERSRAGDGHVVITGMLSNAAGSVVSDVRLKVSLLDEAGVEVGSASAVLTSTALRSGDRVDFRADFPNVYSFATAKLEPQGVRLRSGSGEADPSSE